MKGGVASGMQSPSRPGPMSPRARPVPHQLSAADLLPWSAVAQQYLKQYLQLLVVVQRIFCDVLQHYRLHCTSGQGVAGKLRAGKLTKLGGKIRKRFLNSPQPRKHTHRSMGEARHKVTAFPSAKHAVRPPVPYPPACPVIPWVHPRGCGAKPRAHPTPAAR